MIKPKVVTQAEDRILARCGLAGPLKELLRDDLDWPYILQKSIAEGVSCLLPSYKVNNPASLSWRNPYKFQYCL